MNEVVIPLKIQGIAQMKAELRELKGELANATDTATMSRLAEKAGELTDKINDANDAVNVFATGSKFERIANSFAGIRSSIASLDFEEAAAKAAAHKPQGQTTQPQQTTINTNDKNCAVCKNDKAQIESLSKLIEKIDEESAKKIKMDERIFLLKKVDDHTKKHNK